MIDGGDCGVVSSKNEWWGKLKYSEETYHNTVLSTTDPTRRDPGSNRNRRDEYQATNPLSYGRV
jgi:hypothetical protein